MVGTVFLFSGVALLMHILLNVSLPVGLAGTTLLGLVGSAFLWRKLEKFQRLILRVYISLGIIAGIVATIVYDITKWGLSLVDPSSFDPFGAVPIFGALIVGQSAPEHWHMAAGIAYHVLNGVTFAVAYCILFGHRGTVTGVGWGVFLEAFQFTLYPGWLNIDAFYAEFVTISALAHVAYGATLGYVCKRGLRRTLGDRHRHLRKKS